MWIALFPHVYCLPYAYVQLCHIRIHTSVLYSCHCIRHDLALFNKMLMAFVFQLFWRTSVVSVLARCVRKCVVIFEDCLHLLLTRARDSSGNGFIVFHQQRDHPTGSSIITLQGSHDFWGNVRGSYLYARDAKMFRFSSRIPPRSVWMFSNFAVMHNSRRFCRHCGWKYSSNNAVK